MDNKDWRECRKEKMLEHYATVEKELERLVSEGILLDEMVIETFVENIGSSFEPNYELVTRIVRRELNIPLTTKN